MLFADHLTLDAPRRTTDGYLAVRAKAARTGTYSYLGSEIDPDNKHGLRDAGAVNVLRDDRSVFDSKSAHSFIGKPVTDNHPSVAVNAANWRDHARGVVMGAMRDGEYLAFDLLLTDQSTIAAVDAGKRELSNGYAADLEFGDFAAADGTKCVARQKSISGNHVAIVDKGRAGPSCAITDSVAICDANPAAVADLKPTEKPVKTMLIDGLTVDVGNPDTAIATITRLIEQRDTATTAVGAKDREIATKDTEIASLKTKVTDQAAIDALADAKAEVVARGKELLGDAMPDVKGKTPSEVRRAVVLAVTKDASLADKSDDYIEARFDGLKDTAPTDPLRATIKDGLSAPINIANIRDAARAASNR